MANISLVYICATVSQTTPPSSQSAWSAGTTLC